MQPRLTAEWRLKAALFLAINSVFWPCYQLLSRHALLPIRQVPEMAFDRAVDFEPRFWGWIYLSQFVFTGGLPLFLSNRSDIRRYGVSLAVMSATCFSLFLLLPTRGPRPVETGKNLAMRLIASGDGPLNALPSLHAAFVVCMGCLAARLFGRKAVIPAILGGAAILYSTLATKQHYALDLLAGGLVGWLADAAGWRGSSASATIPARSGAKSQGGDR